MATPWQKILGIIGNTFDFDGGDGPKLKNESGAIASRNAADSAYAIMRGDTPVGVNDLTTKAYVDGLAAGDVNMIEIPFGFADQGSTVDSTFAAVVGGRVIMAKVDITVAFDVDTDVQVGDTGDADRFVVAGDVKETKIGLYEFPQYVDSIASVFRVTLAASAATAGAGRVLIVYAVPTT